jgi:hypothetical protein
MECNWLRVVEDLDELKDDPSSGVAGGQDHPVDEFLP